MNADLLQNQGTFFDPLLFKFTLEYIDNLMLFLTFSSSHVQPLYFSTVTSDVLLSMFSLSMFCRLTFGILTLYVQRCNVLSFDVQ
jgi:hypothetical protein